MRATNFIYTGHCCELYVDVEVMCLAYISLQYLECSLTIVVQKEYTGPKVKG